jgi:hypothetical protein
VSGGLEQTRLLSCFIHGGIIVDLIAAG